MASHKSTPESILNAPDVTRTVIHASPGLNRAERRHGATMARKLATIGRHNHPYTKPTQQER